MGERHPAEDEPALGGFHDYAPVFCDDCEAAISVMMDQDGQVVMACSCLEGRRLLEASNQAWVQSRGHRMGDSTDD